MKRRWIRAYQEGGIGALEHPQSKTMTDHRKNPFIADKPDHEKTQAELIEELCYMRAEVAYLKELMNFTERLLEHCAMAVNGTTKATFGAHTVDFKAPYPRVTMTDAIKQFTGFDITGKTEEELRAFAHSIGIVVDETMGKGKLIDEIFGEKCEGNFI